ncbi:hypothetical protein DPEC_G00316250 [Dallia pectoralis]|uniref:Uncharacterized protein n=1 Tax=Dallia pectoralis TaxID=75939 RepID=A0ACC2FCM6_DALPE|nr:hypothetical protein DPEC_G00316250 [Dallia pectoralis]
MVTWLGSRGKVSPPDYPEEARSGTPDSSAPITRHSTEPLPDRASNPDPRRPSAWQAYWMRNVERLYFIRQPNVCGGYQCCSGWAVASGTNRCIKPDCQPPCQNRGSCSRPNTCVCRSGFQGARCDEAAPEQVYIHTGGALRRIQPGANPFQREQPLRRPAERQAIDRSQTPRPAATRQPVQPVTHVRGQPNLSSPQQTGTSRTVKRYQSSPGPITSNALPSANTHGTGRSRDSHRATANGLTNRHGTNAVVAAGANLTSSLDRIKIVFTPTVCRRVCSGGRCENSCEKGHSTTVYSEHQQQQPKTRGFRLFFCQIPCLNGGRCIGRDQCSCPTNSTGKFCHLPVPPSAKTTPSRKDGNLAGRNSSSYSVYTLPLSNQQASLHPSLVNVHIQHPHQTDVQIHQVARVKPGQRTTTAEGAHSVQQRSQPGTDNGNGPRNGRREETEHGHETGRGNGLTFTKATGNALSRTQPWQNGHVGRCFQETVNGQCGKPLPGLTKQDDCCGSVGASWGLNKCTECPIKPAYAVIANGQVECPKGYKRMNLTHCQDINECLMNGICKNAECLNTRGSYRCTCKPGHMLDPTRNHCVSDKAVSDQRGVCYRSASSGSCSLPIPLHLTKQICCCSRVGKAWGLTCERCPLPDTDHFKEICPAGHGYTYSRSDVQISLRQLEEEEQRQTAVSWAVPNPQPPQWLPTTPRTPHQVPRPQPPLHPDLDTQPPSWEGPGQPDDRGILILPTAVTDLKFPDVIEAVPSHSPSNVGPEFEDKDTASINVATQVTDIDKCSVTPAICGHGQCVPVQTGYTCYCDPGYKLDALQTHCVDVNECEEDPCGGRGRCVNTVGSYTCHCHSGFSQVITQNRKFCQDINECDLPNICQNGDCVNAVGSYTCECKSGYAKSRRGQCEDVDECRNPSSSCPRGRCVNTPGSFQCQVCGPGFMAASGKCLDVNECLDLSVCVHGRCVNSDGSYRCDCYQGFEASADNSGCQDVDECLLPGSCHRGDCVNLQGSFRCSCPAGFQSSPDGRACEDVDECATRIACPLGICINTEGSYSCENCQTGLQRSADGLRCEDVDECSLADVCLAGVCANTEGSFTCTRCKDGYRVSHDGRRCEDMDECQTGSACPNGVCLNSEGSFSCIPCPTGYRISADGELCEDVDECLVANVCQGQMCENIPGSFSCQSCGAGFTLSEDGLHCLDIDECLSSGVCHPGVCSNTEGSYTCRNCEPGFSPALDGLSCEDVDECNKDGACRRGQCINTGGSYLCLCEAGFKFSTDTADCEDQNECTEFGSSVCGTWRCENTVGSYRCFMGCQPGQFGADNPNCDIDECLNETICGDHGFCENTDGSYRCQCDRGYTNPPGYGGGQSCVDVNECEMSTALCGEALCENADGSFLCLCPSDFEEFDPVASQCRPQAAADNTDPRPASPKQERRKECYYNLNDANFCDNVLSRNTTKQECCCTVGTGWGDNCEIHPCPVQGRDEYDQLCPHGSGLLTLISSTQSLEMPSFKDVDECEMFGTDICKNGRCSNIYSSYTCFCRTGFYYDNIRLECVDYDECLTEKACVGGKCVNTPGSFNCFCSPPLILDTARRLCISLNITEEPDEPEEDIHMGVCWDALIDETICSKPLKDRRTTYTECCCLHGVAWGGQCAFCPTKTSDDYATMCNLPRRSSYDSLREGPGYDYDPEGPYIPPYWDNYGPGSFVEPGDTYYSPEDTQGAPLSTRNHDYNSRVRDRGPPPPRVPVHRPREFQPRPVDPYNGRYDGFEGLRAEECGVLNGCENGQCVRVREGYTCDCFDGYELDLGKMACVDINECDDISDKVALCQNASCANTEGSYKCTCLPGFQASARPHECVQEVPLPGLTAKVAGN